MHNRGEFYARNHLQQIEFEIARQIVAALVGEGEQAPVRGSARMRGLARHELFPQVLRIVRLRNGQTLILEMKGEEDDQDRQKYQAARRWVAAVNHWGRLGAWDFAVCRDPQMLPRLVDGIGQMPRRPA